MKIEPKDQKVSKEKISEDDIKHIHVDIVRYKHRQRERGRY